MADTCFERYAKSEWLEGGSWNHRPLGDKAGKTQVVEKEASGKASPMRTGWLSDEAKKFVLAEVRKGRRLRDYYSHRAIAKRAGIHKRTVGKIIAGSR